MSNVRVSVGGHTRNLSAVRVLVLAVAVTLALMMIAVLVGRWSASMQVVEPVTRPAPVRTVDHGQPGGDLLGGLGTGARGASLCLLARPC